MKVIVQHDTDEVEYDGIKEVKQGAFGEFLLLRESSDSDNPASIITETDGVVVDGGASLVIEE